MQQLNILWTATSRSVGEFTVAMAMIYSWMATISMVNGGLKTIPLLVGRIHYYARVQVILKRLILTRLAWELFQMQLLQFGLLDQRKRNCVIFWITHCFK